MFTKYSRKTGSRRWSGPFNRAIWSGTAGTVFVEGWVPRRGGWYWAVAVLRGEPALLYRRCRNAAGTFYHGCGFPTVPQKRTHEAPVGVRACQEKRLDRQGAMDDSVLGILPGSPGTSGWVYRDKALRWCRNLFRRRMREIYRLNRKQLKRGIHLVLIARSSDQKVSYCQMNEEFLSLYRTAVTRLCGNGWTRQLQPRSYGVFADINL